MNKVFTYFSNHSLVTQVVRVWADQLGGLRFPSIKIGYSKPTRAESQEGKTALVESSRVTYYSILMTRVT